MGVEIDPEQDYNGKIGELFDTYYECIMKSEDYSIMSLIKELHPLALECYDNLSILTSSDKHQ